jgi:xylulokinase
MYLGIDLGTSEVKVLLLQDDHRIVATAGARLTVSRPHPGWSEQDPADWWAATESAVAALRAQAPAEFARVRGIGLSGQMHGATLLDADDEVLRPAILWNDVRSASECLELQRRLPALPEIAGNLAMPGFTAPKLLWVQRHEPKLFERTRCVLLPKDWLRLKLTGEKVSEMSDAAGTLWLDVAQRRWSRELLAVSNLSEQRMPRLVEGSAVSGQLRDSLADAWGLPRGIPVAGGGGDNAASAVGIGAVRPGEGFISLGTSGVLFVVTDRFRANPASAVHAFCHAVPGRWHQMSVMLSAASCLSWVTHLVGAADEGALLKDVGALDAAGQAAAPLFLPYLGGERTPHNDAKARGVFFGLSHDTTPAHLGWSVLEGVAFGMLDGLHALQAAGTEVGPLTIVGGGSRSPLWAQLFATLYGVPVRTVHGGEAGGALGAARLAWLATGGSEADVCLAPALNTEYLPEPAARRDALLARHDRFKTLYPTLRAAFAAA